MTVILCCLGRKEGVFHVFMPLYPWHWCCLFAERNTWPGQIVEGPPSVQERLDTTQSTSTTSLTSHPSASQTSSPAITRRRRSNEDTLTLEAYADKYTFHLTTP